MKFNYTTNYWGTTQLRLTSHTIQTHGRDKKVLHLRIFVVCCHDNFIARHHVSTYEQSSASGAWLATRTLEL